MNFERFYLPKNLFSRTLSAIGDKDDFKAESKVDDPETKKTFNRIFLSSDLFTDVTEASEYVCKICFYMAVDPLEHIPGVRSTCSKVFCRPCVQIHAEKGLSFCPTEGCLTTGFDITNLRALGIREVSRLSNLTMNCEFKCGSIVAYRDYMAHREKCTSNPDNFCDTCGSARIGYSHSCKVTFQDMKTKNESLTKDNIELKAQIDALRRELDSLRSQQAEKQKKDPPSAAVDSNSEPNSSDKTKSQSSPKVTKSNEDKTQFKKKSPPTKPTKEIPVNKNGKFDPYHYTNPDIGAKIGSADPKTSVKPTSGQNDEDDGTMLGFLRGAVPQFKFHSNNFLNRIRADGIRLIFHFGEKSFKLDAVEPTFSFRTLRSLLNDMFKCDPGTMLYIRHRTLRDRDNITCSGFKPGVNTVSLVPYDTPDFDEPGFRLSLYRIKYAVEAMDGKGSFPVKSSHKQLNEAAYRSFVSRNMLSFYSNNVKAVKKDTDISLVFWLQGKNYTFEHVKKDQTISSIRSMVDMLSNSDCGKMVYLTHRVLTDDMTIKDSGIKPGTTDITLLPRSFPVDLEETPTLQLIRFAQESKGNNYFSSKFKSSRTNSMASLI